MELWHWQCLQVSWECLLKYSLSRFVRLHYYLLLSIKTTPQYICIQKLYIKNQMLKYEPVFANL